MKKKKILILLLIVVAVACFSFGVSSSVFAAVEDSVEFHDGFNYKEISTNWTSSDAEISYDYCAMRITPSDFDWNGMIALGAYQMTGSCRVEMIISSIDDVSGWFALSAGNGTKNSQFGVGSMALIFYRAQTGLHINNGTSLTASGESNITISPFSSTNVPVKVIVDFNSVASGTYDVTYSLKTITGISIGEHCYNDLEIINGYFGLNSYNANVEITSFCVYEGQTEVYKDDFSESGVLYSTGSDTTLEWVASSAFGEDNVTVGPVGKLDITKAGSYASYVYPYSIPTVNDSKILYRLSAEFYGADMGEYVATGFDFAKETALTSGIFAGITKINSQYKLIAKAGGEIVAESEVGALSEGATIQLEVCWDNTATLTAGSLSLSFEFSNYSVEGYFGLATIELENFIDGALGACIDEFSYMTVKYINRTFADALINFNGTKASEYEGYTYYESYYSSLEWYKDSTVKISRYNSADLDGYMRFSNASTSSVFGPKNRYADYIMRFDITLTGTNYYSDVDDDEKDRYQTANAGELFGIEIGKSTLSQYCDNCTYIGLMDVGYGGTNIVSNKIVNTTNGTSTLALNGYSVWRKDITYNFMFIVSGDTVKMYFKESTEDDSVLSELRAEFDNVSTDGYCAVFGTNGVDFDLDNLSIINLDYSITSTDSGLSEEVETIRALFADGVLPESLNYTSASLVGDALKIRENGNVSTEGTTSSNITRIKIKSIIGSPVYKHGELIVSFADDGNGAKITKGESEQIVTFDYTIDYNGALIEIVEIGSVLYIYAINGNQPLADIYNCLAKVNIEQNIDQKVEIYSTDGEMYLLQMSVFNLKSNVTMTARNFNAETDVINAWSVRTSLQEMAGTDGCSGEITAQPIILLALLLAFVIAVPQIRKLRKHR